MVVVLTGGTVGTVMALVVVSVDAVFDVLLQLATFGCFDCCLEFFLAISICL